jgi:hypothetical protein
VTKFQQVFQLMINQNKETFDEFHKIHDLYSKDPAKYQEEFNKIGGDVQDLIRRYENILCSQSENTGYGKFSTKLSDKFHEEVKSVFPKIDCIGLE